MLLLLLLQHMLTLTVMGMHQTRLLEASTSVPSGPSGPPSGPSGSSGSSGWGTGASSGRVTFSGTVTDIGIVDRGSEGTTIDTVGGVDGSGRLDDEGTVMDTGRSTGAGIASAIADTTPGCPGSPGSPAGPTADTTPGSACASADTGVGTVMDHGVGCGGVGSCPCAESVETSPGAGVKEGMGSTGELRETIPGGGGGGVGTVMDPGNCAGTGTGTTGAGIERVETTPGVASGDSGAAGGTAGAGVASIEAIPGGGGGGVGTVMDPGNGVLLLSCGAANNEVRPGAGGVVSGDSWVVASAETIPGGGGGVASAETIPGGGGGGLGTVMDKGDCPG